MSEKTTILITGVAGYWGARVATRLGKEAGFHVLGLDREPPAKEIKGLDFVQADVRNPLLVELLKTEQVDTVCHLAFVETVQPNEPAFDLNVMGTTKLLGACAEAGVRKVVLKSSTAVYGARPGNASFLTEAHALRGGKRSGTVRDLLEIETFCSGFRHRSPQPMLTILRFASIVGTTVDTPMTRFLKMPQAPGLLGFDPRMQIIHEDDVVEALAQAVLKDVPGIINVAAEDILPLNKIRGLAGKPPVSVPHLLAYWGQDLLAKTGRRAHAALPLEPDYLRYPWVADLSRMRDELGFSPRYFAEDALREFAERHHASPLQAGPFSMARDEEQLRDLIEQRQQARAREAAIGTGSEEARDDE
ncbi:MAG: NAD-dependent epimerase/dehydratase family protein [Anaerolineae bacterium]|nr:NAD-dependent epimerase/dehydratase family protein [Anaerolineae bacterium]